MPYAQTKLEIICFLRAGFPSTCGVLFVSFVNMSVSVTSYTKPYYLIEPDVQYMGRFAQQPSGSSDHSYCHAVAFSMNLSLEYGRTYVLCAPHISMLKPILFYLSLQLISCCCYLVPALSVLLSHVAKCDLM